MSEEQSAGFELVIQRADKITELGDGVGELDLIEVAAGVFGDDSVFPVGDLIEKDAGGFTLGSEVGEECLVHGGAGVVEQGQHGFTGAEAGEGVFHGKITTA
jgi:hypothetical protein